MKESKALNDWLHKALRIQPATIDVGFFQDARYASGESVAQVAATNEFGTSTIPARPFFRLSIEQMAEEMPSFIMSQIDVEKGEVNPQLAKYLGLWASAMVAETITTLSKPPNSPTTIARKKSSNPLIDSAKMRNSVDWRVV